MRAMDDELVVKSIHLPVNQQIEMLDRIDAEAADVRAIDQEPITPDENDPSGYSFRNPDVIIRVTHPGGGVARFYVASRLLSEFSMVFLHGGFLHVRTECDITLPTLWGGAEDLKGEVTECRHLAGSVHQVRVTFDQEIDLRHYIEGLDPIDISANTEVDPLELCGRILILDEMAIEHELIEHHLRDTRIKLAKCSTPDEVVASFKEGLPDLVLCDLDLGEQDVGSAIEAIRAAGFRGPIIGATGETHPGRISRAKALGVCTILQKPYDPHKMLATLSHWLMTVGAGSDEIPVESTFASEPGLADLIPTYLERVKEMLEQYRAAVNDEDLEKVRYWCQVFRETGASFGYQELTDLAFEAVTSLDATSSVVDASAELRRVEQMCQRLR